MVQMPTAGAASSSAFLALLQQAEDLDPKLLTKARKLVGGSHAHLERALVAEGVLGEAEIARIFASQAGLPLLPPGPPQGDVMLAMMVPEKLCAGHLLAPLADRGDSVEVAFATPDGLAKLDLLQFLLGRPVQPVVAPLSAIDALVESLYRSNQEVVGSAGEFGGEEEAAPQVDENVLDLEATPPADEGGRVIRMVNQILEQAIRTGRQRHPPRAVRGRLQVPAPDRRRPPRAAGAVARRPSMMILSRFKILAKMDIAEKRLPQDGAIALKSGDRRIDLRVNTVPTDLRREDGHATPRQGGDPARPRQARARPAAGRPT